MRIAFDQQVFLLQRYGGISRYISRLAEQLSKKQGMQVRIIAPLHFNSHLADLNNGLTWGMRAPRVPKTFRLVHAASEALARQAMNAFHPDVVHETYFSHTSVAPKGSRRVITVYDMIHERFPSLFLNSHLTSGPKKAATMRADHVLCISENTRRDLIEMFNIPESKVSVVHIAFDQLAPSVKPPVSSISAAERPYLFYVGSREGYKNFDRFLQAYASSPFLSSTFSLVCFGGGTLRAEEVARARSLGLSETQITQVGGDDAVLANLYFGAAAFVYPSLYEGFGIPLLEAMSLRCPVICSHTSSFPEVAGEAAEYFEPDDVESIRSAMEGVLQSPTKRDELIRSGQHRCALFSWARCAEQTMEIYRGLM